ncbi:hypothetical protein FRC07_006746, partial [Ceratobasidium sp. 392]
MTVKCVNRSQGSLAIENVVFQAPPLLKSSEPAIREGNPLTGRDAKLISNLLCFQSDENSIQLQFMLLGIYDPVTQSLFNVRMRDARLAAGSAVGCVGVDVTVDGVLVPSVSTNGLCTDRGKALSTKQEQKLVCGHLAAVLLVKPDNLEFLGI